MDSRRAHSKSIEEIEDVTATILASREETARPCTRAAEDDPAPFAFRFFLPKVKPAVGGLCRGHSRLRLKLTSILSKLSWRFRRFFADAQFLNPSP